MILNHVFHVLITLLSRSVFSKTNGYKEAPIAQHRLKNQTLSNGSYPCVIWRQPCFQPFQPAISCKSQTKMDYSVRKEGKADEGDGDG